MAAQGNHRTLYLKMLFRVYSEAFLSAAFMSAEGLKYSIAKIEYWEGGALVSEKEAGRATFDDIVMQRGASQDPDFYTWVQLVIDIVSALPGGKGAVSPQYKRDLTIRQLERDLTPVTDYPVKSCFPVEWTPGDFNNDADEVTMNSLTLCQKYFTQKMLGPATP